VREGALSHERWPEFGDASNMRRVPGGNRFACWSGADLSRTRATFGERDVVDVAPAYRLPDTSCHPIEPAMRRNTRLRGIGGSKIPAFGPGARLAACCGLGNPPREGRDPGLDRGAFSPSGCFAARGSLPRQREHRSPPECLISDLVESRRLWYPAINSATCDEAELIRGLGSCGLGGISNPSPYHPLPVWETGPSC
jgi:hypothetical protein